jgi:hypothetical protein
MTRDEPQFHKASKGLRDRNFKVLVAIWKTSLATGPYAAARGASKIPEGS